jgi:hypothetical protein
MSDRPKPMTGAERMRLHRYRKKTGKCSLWVELDKGLAADKLTDIHILEEWSSESMEAIGQALLSLAAKNKMGA